jgi:putative SOS response-associated peptidase YedK
VLPPKSADNPARRIASLRNLESPFWIGNLRNSEFRCIVPASAIMAWGSGTDYEGRRLRHWLALEDESGAPMPLFAMLGVWKDEEVPAFALVTREASGLARELGAKTQPVAVPLRSAEARAWLHGGWESARAIARLSQPLGLTSVPDR